MARRVMRTFLFFATCLFVIIIDTFADMPSFKYTQQADRTCNACQFAIKELDYWLRMTGKTGHYSLEAAVAKSIEAVCNKKNVKDDRIRKKIIQCQKLLEEHGLLIKEALIEHFESDEPRSYLKLIQEVCHEKLSLCSLGKQAKDDFENSMRFNTVDKMEVSFSGTIKAVNPVKESD